MTDYPKWRHHPEKESVLVHSQDWEESLTPESEGWSDSRTPEDAPRKPGRPRKV